MAWLFVEARDNHDCPRCGQPKGEPCRTPGGRKTSTPHTERVRALTKKEIDSCRVAKAQLPKA